MSYSNYLKAVSLLPQCKNYETSGGQVPGVIQKAESALGIKFSWQTRDYLTQFGYVAFFGSEIAGIVCDDFDDLSIPANNMVKLAMANRKEHGLPNKWLPIYCFGYDGYYGYLDYSQLNLEGEPPVIMAAYNGKEFFIEERVAEDFGDFLLELVKDHLDDYGQEWYDWQE